MPGKHFDLDTDINLGGENASDIVIPSQKAVKSYIDAKPSGGGSSSLTELTDVSISSTNDGDILSYDISENAWVNKALSIPTDTNDLTNGAGFITVESIPSNVSSFTNDAGYLTEHQSLTGYAQTTELSDVAFSGDYDDLLNKPTIPIVPTNVSSFTNDAGYLTSHQDVTGKANLSELSNVATSGDYNDLLNKPTIPSNTSDLINDSGFITNHQDISGKANTSELASVAFTGDYNDLTNTPTIPVIPSDAVFTDTTYTGGTGLTVSGTIINHTNSITSGTAGTSEASNGANISIPYITYDAQGHITEVGNRTHTVSGFLTEHQDISGKANISEMSTVAFSGDYTDLDNKPTIPTVTNTYSSTSDDAMSGKAVASAISELAIPSDTNDLTNGAGFITASALPSKVSDLNNDSGFTSNTGTITGITMNNTSMGTSGVVDLGTVLTEHQDISGKANLSELSSVARSGDYDDLLNKPTIPTVPSTLSSFTDDLGTNPTHTHSQYLTSHQDISGLATDSLVVHLAGTETISGDKTFSGNVSLGSNATATTPTTSDDSTKIATTAFVKAQGYLTSIGSHNQDGNTITALTGYAIATGSSAITTSDSLNVALGKLEYKVNNAASGGLITVSQLMGS